jgi:hypothetical protein
MEIDEPLSNDEKLLLRYQNACTFYFDAVLRGSEDLDFEREYIQSEIALDGLDDPILKELALDACGTNVRRREESREELLALSRRVKNLFPGERYTSTRVH